MDRPAPTRAESGGCQRGRIGRWIGRTARAGGLTAESPARRTRAESRRRLPESARRPPPRCARALRARGVRGSAGGCERRGRGCGFARSRRMSRTQERRRGGAGADTPRRLACGGAGARGAWWRRWNSGVRAGKAGAAALSALPLQRHVDSSSRAGRHGVARVMRPDSSSRCGVADGAVESEWISSDVRSARGCQDWLATGRSRQHDVVLA